MKCNLAHIFLL